MDESRVRAIEEVNLPSWCAHDAEVHLDGRIDYIWGFGAGQSSSPAADTEIFGAPYSALWFCLETPPNRAKPELKVKALGSTLATLPVDGTLTWEEAVAWMRAVHVLTRGTK